MNDLLRRRGMMGENGYQVMWNQLLNTYTHTREGISYYRDENNDLVISGYSTIYNGGAYIYRINGNYGDKVFVRGPLADTGYGYIEFDCALIGWRPFPNKKIEKIQQSKPVLKTFIRIDYKKDMDIYARLTNPYVIDLTLMFGAGNEPTSSAQFESWLQENGINPDEYIPYNEGEIRTMTKPSWIQ